MAPFIGQNIGEDQKKRSSLQNELVFSPKVCDDQIKKVFISNQWVFGLYRKKTNKLCHPKMVTPGTVLNSFTMLSQLPPWLGAYGGMFTQFMFILRNQLTNSEDPNNFGDLSDAARNVEAFFK